MSEITELIKSAYLNLSYSEKIEIISFIIQSKDSTIEDNDLLKSELDKSFLRSAGPRNANVCPRCGK